ncbi:MULTISPECIES: M23 family metallopeptidase [Bacillus cereus group]|uniref:Peptidase M23 n=1 Tax=Bacillus wiedmannii TaxID=1890302 RepID=A0A2A8MS80_9BACI|nr:MULTISPECIES: M23 family metallopeptidase [Bacillus cereus group]MDA1641925.1 M23 family metallopeptidase [Bacillus cereus group sp. TH177-1LC]PEI56132.1 peptidase M23 [Bacillus wiedmannii]PEL73224.1 peptidase M23 [Bacillus wiedmannii]PEM47417.1 peptidase M23 [Bacillus wiedmannii]PEO07960.1 peptidase M23 [Bacillus wiedmannii]
MATFIYPTDTTRITSGFRGDRPDHHGIDLAEAGYHPIYAAAGGQVSRSYFSTSYGECIMIVHNINGVTWETVYAHMRSGSRTVKQGDYVTQGQTIGVMGETGQAYGQHLHFEMHKGSWNINKSNAVNPLDYLGKGGIGGTPQPEGIGFAKSIYWEGYGINYYDGPHGNYLGDFTTAAEVLYWDAYWGEDNDVWLDLGRSRWVKAEHYYWRPFKAISKFPEGYEVSYCDGIDGAYKGSINSKEPLTVFFRKEGWIDIGGNRWTPEKHFDIVDIR